MKTLWLTGSLEFLLIASVACAQPQAAPAGAGGAAATRSPLTAFFGPDADLRWTTTGGYTVSGLETPVLTAESGRFVLDGRTRYPAGIEVRALLRLRSFGNAPASAEISLGRHEGKSPTDPNKTIEKNLAIRLTGNKAAMSVTANCMQDGKPLHDLKALAATCDWTPQNQNSFTYELQAYTRYLPGWAEDFRARIEHDMSELPDLDAKWLCVRVEAFKGSVRFWLDDRLVAWKEEPAVDPEGTLRLTLSPGSELREFKVTARPATTANRYEPIRLEGYANARAFLRGASVRPESLPPAGDPVEIQGVPFIFPGVNPEGKDHLDIGRSLFRQANTPGYLPTGRGNLPRWLGSASRDPARIQLRVPFGAYNALHLVAACDDEPDSVPLISAMFYRPGAGFARTVEGQVPLATASGGDATPVGVTLSDGRKVNLWRVTIPIDPAVLTSFADLDVIEVELTKKVRLYRSYPDPISYGYHQAGLPSAVHVFAATLARAPVVFTWDPDRFGHVWTAPETPGYTATLRNDSGRTVSGVLRVTTRSYDGTEETRQEKKVRLPPGEPLAVKVPVNVRLFGYHDITATIETPHGAWSEARSFVRLAPDTRSVRWTEGRGAMFGYWSYAGGHHTPNAPYHTDLMTLAGARQSVHPPATVTDLMKKHWGRAQGTAYYVTPQAWAAEPTPDPAKIAAFEESITKAFEKWEGKLPDEWKPDHVYYFTESHISPRLTAGNFPEYWQDPPFQYTDEEQKRLRMFYETARIAGEFLRKAHPERKILIEWGSPVFAVPLLRAGFPTNLIDGSGLDMPLFERLPEMQLADDAVHQLYELREEFRRVGINRPRLQYCEGIFVPTEPGAVSWREQMDSYNRWALISMAYGVERFYGGWFAFDCGNWYGAEHYGGCGIQRRVPYCDPKPAYAAYATMTEKLNEANFDGWLPTGSLTTYCLRFRKADDKGYVYALWTLRGRRPVTLTLAGKGRASVTDAMNNTKTLAGGRATTLVTDPSVVYVTGTEIVSVSAGEPDHSDAAPAPGAVPVADLGDGSWRVTGERDELYENNHWGFYPAAGRFSAQVVDDPAQGRVLASKLETQGRPRDLMPWYTILRPGKPVSLKGAPSHLGLWVHGASDWGRVIYVLRDARGERWLSIGAKDSHNCNDTHSWSSFNFDGWRYLRFELPGHEGYDNYRKAGTTWWRSGVDFNAGPVAPPVEKAEKPGGETGDNIVDLPLALEEVIVEQRTHILYVNDKQPVASDTVRFGRLFAEYESADDASDEAVRASRLRMPVPEGRPNLPNPIERMAREGVGEPARLIGLRAPEHRYDGTRMHVLFEEVPGARKYHVWVGTRADGSGAADMVPAGIKPGALIQGLRPGIKLYYWISYEDAENRMSKPSNVHEEVTVDNFKEK